MTDPRIQQIRDYLDDVVRRDNKFYEEAPPYDRQEVEDRVFARSMMIEDIREISDGEHG